MHVHINHMFCTDPCWGKTDTMYWCRYLVAIQRNGSNGSYYDTPEADWTNLTEKHDFFDEDDYNRRRASEIFKKYSDDYLKDLATKSVRKLKSEVVTWLEENVEDRKDKDYPKGYCYGSDAYMSNDMSVSIFFERRSDALAFIKRWSSYGKPTTYFDYFKGIRKEFNPKTGTLQKVESFS